MSLDELNTGKRLNLSARKAATCAPLSIKVGASGRLRQRLSVEGGALVAEFAFDTPPGDGIAVVGDSLAVTTLTLVVIDAPLLLRVRQGLSVKSAHFGHPVPPVRDEEET